VEGLSQETGTRCQETVGAKTAIPGDSPSPTSQILRAAGSVGDANSAIPKVVARENLGLRRGTCDAFRLGMSKITSFRDLLVWQKSMNLAERCYRISKRFPRDEQLVLGHQIRKSCISVPSNIAEGFGRHHTSEYIHYLRFSKGSNNELQTQVELAKRVQILSEEDAAALISDAEEVGRMLHGLVNSLGRTQ